MNRTPLLKKNHFFVFQFWQRCAFKGKWMLNKKKNISHILRADQFPSVVNKHNSCYYWYISLCNSLEMLVSDYFTLQYHHLLSWGYQYAKQENEFFSFNRRKVLSLWNLSNNDVKNKLFFVYLFTRERKRHFLV